MYSYEERMEAVKLYIDCGFSFATVRRKLGYPGQYSSLRAWYEEYAQTSELRESMKRSDKYTKEEKRRRNLFLGEEKSADIESLAS